MFAPYVDRADYVASVSNGLGYCLAVEKLAELGGSAARPGDPRDSDRVEPDLQPPGMAGHATAWTSAPLPRLFYTFREREYIMDIYEKYCGARLTTHAFRIGGLQYRTLRWVRKECREFCDWLPPKLDEYEQLLSGNRILVARMTNVGVLTARTARHTASPDPCCGPPA